MAFLLIAFIVLSGAVGLVWAWMNFKELSEMDVEDIDKVDD